MVLQPVEQLSDEDCGQPPQLPTSGKKPAKAKASPKPKADPSDSSPKPAAENPDDSKKRPATSAEKGGVKKMKRPAAAGEMKVSKGFVKRDGKYSFKINGSQKLLVHWLH